VRPKLHDVSALAGVSLATVSRVLNGKEGVAHDTRQRVIDALAELGYRDVPVRPAASGVVGIVTPELDNPIFPLLAQTVESRLARQGMLTMICPVTSDTVNEQEYLDHFTATRAAGVVVINGRYAGVEDGYGPYLDMVERGVRTVLVNGVGRDCPLPAVTVDIEAGGAMSVRHLVALGHRRIGCLTGPRRYQTTRQFLTGYHSAMNDAGIVVDGTFVSETLFTIEGGRAGIVQLIEADVTAIVCAGDLIALGAVAGLCAWGYRVPQDVSVVGFDGTALVAHTDPSLTSVRQPVERMAQTIATLLTTETDGPANIHLVAPDLIVGHSTGRAPA
jgi:DNA-binding LacI/PurR family transcriptional regulator